MSRKKLIVIIGSLVIVWMLLNRSDSIDSFISEVKIQNALNIEDSLAWKSFDEGRGSTVEQELLEKIRKEAIRVNEPPIGARIDRVWKAIPGYNGIEIDVQKTYRLAQFSPGSSDIPYVFREIPPTVTLEQLPVQPIYKGNPKKPMVSLMINVAWGDEFLPGMLNILRKENVKATFFLDGTWLSKNQDTVKQIWREGHEISNHAYSHKNMSALGREEAKQEIIKTQRLLEQLGIRNQLFAPPSGDYDEETVQIAHELHLKTILWTIDTVDWKKTAPEWIIRKIKTRLEPGALILMHPTRSSSMALQGMIDEIKKRGLAIGTVSELISPARIRTVETDLHF